MIAYAGTAYAGWQRQSTGTGVQQRVEEAAVSLFGAPVDMEGASRTDAGVHARGQSVSFRAGTTLAAGRMAQALNAHLPADIVVRSVSEAAPGFRARRDARWKRYEYRISAGETVAPFEAPYVWHRPGRLRVERLRECATLVAGEHDFRGFCAEPERAGTGIRRLHEVGVEECGDGIVSLLFVGDAFLYRMVRMLVGAMVGVADGQADLALVRQTLDAPGSGKAGATAPARGLCLLEVGYAPFDRRG